MPKQSKITTSSKPGRPAPVEPQPDMFYCVRCNRSFTIRKRNFPASQSSLYRGNGGFLPVCRHCVDEIYEHYLFVLGDEKSAMHRVCMKFDIYWSEKIFGQVNRSNTTNSRILSYLSKANLAPNTGKTYDDTLDEEQSMYFDTSVTSDEDDQTQNEFVVTNEMIDFWGAGMPAPFYAELEKRYRYWRGDTDKSSVGKSINELSDLAFIKQICMLEATITREAAAGKSIDKYTNSLNTLLGSANLKPIQQKEKEDLDASIESMPFGSWIRKIENTRPIAEPDPEFKDVDGIAKYVSVWFLGHLCHMLKIENKYSHLYEAEMARLRVDRPEYEGEDEETIMEDIFERASRLESEEDEAEDA